MSTRSHILIKENGQEIKLYHHCDGYPEGVGADLKQFLKGFACWNADYIATDLVKGAVQAQRITGWKPDGDPIHGLTSDDGYEITTGVHGDEEYVYVIDCNEKTLTCYAMDWDDPIEETIRKNRVQEIPDKE